ncbi:MAG: RlmE family RNA methyltransferase [Treponema sp.]|jgi:23S rRNA (uridine2552-2'-O)-methyltransferase|nr:RlmE family RNA methyltransferase [Treponema sp.]
MADYKKPDYWQLKARNEGYPARSVYKLMEIDEKFSILKKQRNSASSSLRVLDIGAAPGSWSLFALRKFSEGNNSWLKNGFLAASDLLPLSREFDKGLFDGDNFFFIQGDVTADDVRKALLSKGPYSVIISDAAPNTTGNHMVDSARSLELAEIVIMYAESALVPGGNLALKVFQGSGVDAVLKKMKMLFETVKSFKPQACRGESVETYYVGLGKK